MRTQQRQVTSAMTMELVLSQKQLLAEELPFLAELGPVRDGILFAERSFKGWRLKTPVRIAIDRVLALGQKGLAEYIIKALIPYRPRLIPWVLENQSLIVLAKHMLRSGSGSLMGFCSYTNTVSLYSRRLNADPDKVIADVKPDGDHPDPVRVDKHRKFLEDCLAELQDHGRTPGRLHSYARHIRTFYRINGVEIRQLSLPRPRVFHKDRAPTSEELQCLIDIAALRERVILSFLALGGFRVGTLARLEYRHVKEDLEKGVVPLHLSVESEIVKGKYSDYDAFLGQEAVSYLNLYLEQRRRGSPDGKIPPEKIHEHSPLIRDTKSPLTRPVGEKQIGKLIRGLYHKAGLLKYGHNGRHDLRAHSIRKYFKTQLKALGVDNDYIDYWMGHLLDTYHDIQSKGIEFQRNIYAKADLRISPKAQISKQEMIVEAFRHMLTPEQLHRVEEALSEPHRIYANPKERADTEVQILARAVRDSIKEQLQQAPHSPDP